MNEKIWSVSGALLVSVALSACGGGGGGGSGSGGGGTGGSGGSGTPELVDGELRFENETDNFKNYQNPDADARQDACDRSDYYLESDNFMVYVDTGQTYSKDDLRTAATKAQNAMDAILPRFGMTWSDFYAMKRIISFSDIDQFAIEASQLGLPTSELAQYFPGIPDGTETEQQAFIYNALVDEETPANVRTTIDTFIADNSSETSPLTAITPIHDKIQICATTSDRIARSSTSGLKIAPSYSDENYRHESTHLIINQVSKFPAFWALEGQTHLILEGGPASVEDVASIRNSIIGTDESEPGRENINRFKEAYLALSARTNNDIGKVMDWHRDSMKIKAEWLTTNDGTSIIISDDERIAGVKEAFGIVMGFGYDEFFDDLSNP
ncbi:hypothetical protein LPB19_00720 [Marinobacter salinisoli]|uniref:Uncharacterized protein n=1 Tax=Marinobacter salinisoli TaxID=2769486 RepID=A0ABX7MRJ7_9GAMM|nr:hypothetical protein [Marinobacter salinisoli]QSP94980.1 hypothetical protein LPB19_00720 [Marinobacter salinisoli]